MFAIPRKTAALALRGTSVRAHRSNFPQLPQNPELINWVSTAKPSTALLPYRSIAAISSSASKPAAPAVVSRDEGLPLSVTGKVRREVPLPSQEGKKGVMQYALYATYTLQISFWRWSWIWDDS